MTAGRRGPLAQRGFTLVEVLVALLVMALMAGMAWQGVAGVMRARDNTQAHLEQTLRLNTIIAQWDQDLAALQDGVAVPPLAFDGATVRLTRRTDDGLQVVAWSLHPEIAGGTWLRWAGTPVTTVADLQDQWFRTQQFQGVEPGQMRTLSGVASWQVYFYRGNAWTNAQSSAETSSSTSITSTVVVPPPTPAASETSGAGASGSGSGASGTATAATVTQRPVLPTGVRIVLTFGDGSGYNGSLVRDVALGPQWP